MAQGPLGDILSKVRRQSEERDAQRRAAKAGLPYLNLAASPVETDALGLIPEEKAKTSKMAVVEYKSNKAALAVFDPEDKDVKAIIKELEAKGITLKVFVVSLSGLKYAWDFYKYVIAKTVAITGRMEIDKERIDDLKKRL